MNKERGNLQPYYCSASIVIPAFNEQENIQRSIDTLRRVFQNHTGWEILVIDDGSTDLTSEIALFEARQDPLVKVVRHPVNQGLGAAIRTALAHAQGEFLVTLDVDLSYDATTALALLNAIRTEGSDLVVASPYGRGGSTSGSGTTRILLSRAANLLYRLVVGGSLTCYTSMARAYRKTSLTRVHWKSNRYESQAEIIARMLWNGFKVQEIPAELRSRRSGSSKMRLGRAAISHALLLFRLLAMRITARRADLSG